MKYKSRSIKDDYIQEAMLRCMQVPSIIALGLIDIEKLT